MTIASPLPEIVYARESAVSVEALHYERAKSSTPTTNNGGPRGIAYFQLRDISTELT